ncbi:hypothetical protein P153DRAFT_140922 [Dothidotthia symphoricarpi CBS 119687]|uniref:Uncharacterized protein n=1 Tax=Dothidotthia symphoricarpi CBS 119687 TaxID=1392245 RepID=A0A6A5ZZY9_9PLEO|nr:uncharacterized protein P153DRAFT_140922 [Dothidotthia symphoricarpi CBS 119687]KAF2123901.1 hypothetical protein P153DRAFT_140922 [Dothidotthia symphoricarpi CBS 119687]
MSQSKLIVSIDSIILSHAAPTDCLVLSREVNKSFSTAFAVGQLTAGSLKGPQLLSQNIFTWTNEFQITAWKSYEDGPFAAAVCNSVQIEFQQTTRFIDCAFEPAKPSETQDWTNPPQKTFAIENLEPYFRVGVSQRARPEGLFFPIYTSPDADSLQVRTEIYISDKFALFWLKSPVEAGNAILLPDKSKVHTVIVLGNRPQHVRYGYITPDKPGADEVPGWFQEPVPRILLSISPATLVKTTFQLEIDIDDSILKMGATDKLLCARKVDGMFSSVFDGYSIAPNKGEKQLLSKNSFQWSAERIDTSDHALQPQSESSTFLCGTTRPLRKLS